ncbi:MAG: RIP metalloprotease RseP [Candidatus Omnitrophota bacterium]
MNLESLFSNVSTLLHFAVVLGLAVIFHEWGHFIVAKLSGAKVDRFSVGFGKILYSHTWHNTEYCLCALPLGGYVKIRGMDPDEELTGAEWEFLQLAPWKRILIVFAGPAMNVVLSFLIYIFVFAAFGEAFHATTTIGRVPAGSWGWEMGLRNGDRILTVNGEKVSSWEDIADWQSNIADRDALTLTIDRNGQVLSKQKEIPAWIKEPADKNKNAATPPPTNGQGVFITQVIPGGAAERAGLQAGEIILSVDGKTFQTRNEWSDYITSLVEKNVDGAYQAMPIAVAIQDEKQNARTLHITPDLIVPASDAEVQQPQSRLGFTFDGEISLAEYLTPTIAPLGVAPKIPPVIGIVQVGSPAEQANIAVGSTIVKLNEKPIDDWVDVILTLNDSIAVQENGKAEAKPVEIIWLTPNNEMKQAAVTPEVIEQPILTQTSVKTGKTYKMAQIGISNKPDRRKLGVIGSISYGWSKLLTDLTFMVDFLHKLFTGEVSPKLLGGPVAIFQLSGEYGRWGLERFLGFIALLSANLALINLFPLPPFDGGHIVFYTIEILRRKPLTMRQMEMFGKVGAVLVIPLILFLVINDLIRTKFFSWLSGLIFG